MQALPTAAKTASQSQQQQEPVKQVKQGTAGAAPSAAIGSTAGAAAAAPSEAVPLLADKPHNAAADSAVPLLAGATEEPTLAGEALFGSPDFAAVLATQQAQQKEKVKAAEPEAKPANSNRDVIDFRYAPLFTSRRYCGTGCIAACTLVPLPSGAAEEATLAARGPFW